MSGDLRIRVLPSIGEVPADVWDGCANPEVQGVSSLPGFNPFISHDFLSTLEESRSVQARTGWQPQHLLAEDDSGRVLGVAPCYLKSHSQGEYVFDRGWAEAYERAGGEYYPKLQVSVPFTPATGRRLLVRPSPGADIVRSGLIAGLLELCGKRHASSVHFTFLPEPECRALVGHGFLPPTHH